jgi:phenolic acid decarboxylase
MAAQRSTDSMTGKTIRWTFNDGPTAGMTFEHTINADGSVDWCAVKEGRCGESTHEDEAAAVKVADGVFAVSYLSESGYTLTTILNLPEQKMVGFASNGETWTKQSGKFEVLGEETNLRKAA